MSALTDTLPWSSLRLNEPEIPWDDLRTLADAAAESSEVRSRLVNEINELLDRREAEDEESYPNLADLAVPAVFALAAERFNDAGQREVAEFLIHLLCRAGETGDDFMLDVIELAAGRLGPALIEPAMKLIESKGHDLECWFHLFGLLNVAADADSPTKEAVIRLCRRVIREAPDRFECFSSAEPAARVLASLGDSASLPLIRSIFEVSQSGDLEEAIGELEGRGDPSGHDLVRPWTTPVEEWLPERVEQVRSYLADEESEEDILDDEYERESAYDRYGDLRDEFLASHACEVLPETAREHAAFTVDTFLQHSWEYLGVAVEKLAACDVREILLDLFPRKISADKEFFESAPSVLVAFIGWLGEIGRVADPRALCAEVTQLAKELLKRSQDRRNWGPAKSFLMQAEADGVDISDKEAMDRYMLLYNLRHLPAARTRRDPVPVRAPDPEYGDPDDFATQPIVRKSFKVGRNEPCPCGSGKKYKKCCGP